MSIRLIVRTIGMCLFGALMISTVASAQTREERQREFLQEIIKEKMRMTPEQFRQLIEQQGRTVEKDEPWQQSHSAEGFEDGPVSEDASPESEIHAAINPLDNNNIVVSAMRYGSGASGLTMPIYYTKDFGKTWNKSSFVTRPNGVGAQVAGGGDPMFAFGPDGTVYFSWIYLSLEGTRYDSLPFTVYWAYSTNGGESWQMAKNNTIGSGRYSLIGGTDIEVFDKQWMAVDTTSSPYRGTLYTAMLQATPLASHIVVRRKRASDETFSQVSTIVDVGNFTQVQFASMGIGLSGDVHVTFYGNLGSEAALWHAVSTDGGETFAPATLITPIKVPRFSPDQNGQTIPGIDASRMNPSPQLAIDRSKGPNRGALYVVWAGNGIDSKLDNGLDIYLSRSMDNGAVWSPPIIVNDDKPGMESHQFLPSITVNPLGYLSITWYDRRDNDDPYLINTNYYIVHSFDGGETFTPNFPVSSAPTDYSNVGQMNSNFGVGDYTQVVSTSGYVIPFWADGRGGDGDLNIYSAFIPYDQSVPSSVERTATISEKFQMMDPVVKPGDISVRFALTEPSEISVSLVDMAGTVVASIPARNFQPGTHTTSLDAAAVPSGTYMVVAYSRFGSASRTAFVAK
jgi:hypothetical protein